MDILLQIKRLVLQGRVRFTEKARTEMAQDGLTADQVVESIINARRISKTLRSISKFRRNRREKLYVIRGKSYDGILIYSKGTIVREADHDVFYILISAKTSGGTKE